jgi:acetyltransferase-like isoleucine patch superfamily enzyme
MSATRSIISGQIRVRHPSHFHVGEGSIVDDYSYFSTKLFLGRWSHIASGCTLAGGFERTVRIGNYSSVSAGVRVWCTSDDFVNDIVTILPPGCPSVKENLIQGDVTLDSYTAVGANSVVMPENHVPEGVAIGALSFVPPRFRFQPWSVYAGNPLRLIKARNKASVLSQVERIEAFLSSRVSAQ